jgi:hypothetical protein
MVLRSPSQKLGLSLSPGLFVREKALRAATPSGESPLKEVPQTLQNLLGEYFVHCSYRSSLLAARHN